MINVCLQSAQKYNKDVFCVLSLYKRRHQKAGVHIHQFDTLLLKFSNNLITFLRIINFSSYVRIKSIAHISCNS